LEHPVVGGPIHAGLLVIGLMSVALKISNAVRSAPCPSAATGLLVWWHALLSSLGSWASCFCWCNGFI